MSRFAVRTAALLPTVLLGACLDSRAGLPTGPNGEQFAVALELQSTSLAPGQPLQCTLVVSNAGDARGALGFSSGCQINFLVRDESGVVWDDMAMALRICTQDAPTVEFAPGQSRTWGCTWDQGTPTGPAAPGDYHIEVTLLSVPHLPSAEAAFSIRDTR